MRNPQTQSSVEWVKSGKMNDMPCAITLSNTSVMPIEFTAKINACSYEAKSIMKTIPVHIDNFYNHRIFAKIVKIHLVSR